MKEIYEIPIKYYYVAIGFLILLSAAFLYDAYDSYTEEEINYEIDFSQLEGYNENQLFDSNGRLISADKNIYQKNIIDEIFLIKESDIDNG